MSASLVGSEMCIRDRSPYIERHGAQQKPQKGDDDTVPPEHLAAIRIPGPVSYTHLTLPTICSV
eukprot:4322189-Alexandrium_andersonii.AAC.1